MEGRGCMGETPIGNGLKPHFKLPASRGDRKTPKAGPLSERVGVGAISQISGEIFARAS